MIIASVEKQTKYILQVNGVMIVLIWEQSARYDSLQAYVYCTGARNITAELCIHRIFLLYVRSDQLIMQARTQGGFEGVRTNPPFLTT